MDYRGFGKSTWENETSRRYRERSLYFKPRTDTIYVDGKRHRVNNYVSTTDSPVSPFGRNHILLNASPQGMLKVSRRSGLPHEWAPRLITTDYSLPSTPQRCQSSMDLRKSVAYTSAEDIRYHAIRKTESCDNILTRGQYLSPGPPQSESGVSVSDLESIFVDDDAQSQSSLSSFDRSFSYSEFDGESIHDRLNVINEDEAFVNPGSESLATGSAHNHLASGRVNPNVLAQELRRLKDEREKRKKREKLRKSQDVKAYIENNFPSPRNLSSTSADSCLGRSVGDEADGNSLHENYGQTARRRLNYSPGSPFSQGSSGIGHSRFASVDDDCLVTSTETTFIDNLPGSYEHEREGGMLKARNNSYKRYDSTETHGDHSQKTKFSFDRTGNDSVNSSQLDYERRQNVSSDIQLSNSQNEYSQSDSEYLRRQNRYTSSPKISENREDITHIEETVQLSRSQNECSQTDNEYVRRQNRYTSSPKISENTKEITNTEVEETVEFSDIDIQIDDSLESKHDQSDILNDVLNMSKHAINVDEWEEDDNKIENSLESDNLFSEQISIVSESHEDIGENLQINDSLEKVQSLKSSNLDNRDYSTVETIDFRDKKTREDKYNSWSTVETIDYRDQKQESYDDSSISEHERDNSTDFHASINSQTPVAGRLTPGSDTSLFTREIGERNSFTTHKKEISLNTIRAESNYHLVASNQSRSSSEESGFVADDTSRRHKNSRHFSGDIDGSVSHSSDQDYTKTTVVTDSFIGRSLDSQSAENIRSEETEIGTLSQFGDRNRGRVGDESYYTFDFEGQDVTKEAFIEEDKSEIEKEEETIDTFIEEGKFEIEKQEVTIDTCNEENKLELTEETSIEEKQDLTIETVIEENTVNSKTVDHSSLSAHQTDDGKNTLSVEKEPLVQYDESATVEAFTEENKSSGISEAVLKRECESSEPQLASSQRCSTNTTVTKHYYNNQDVVNEEKAHTNKPKQTQLSEIRGEIEQDRISDEIHLNVQRSVIKENISAETEFTFVRTNLEIESISQIQTDIEEKKSLVQDLVAEDSESNRVDDHSGKISLDNSVSGYKKSEKINRNQVGEEEINRNQFVEEVLIEEKRNKTEEIRTVVQYLIVDNEFSSTQENHSSETKELENISPGITSEYSTVETNTLTHVDSSIVHDNYSISDSDREEKTKDTSCQYAIINENTWEYQERNTVTGNKHSVDSIVKVDENEITELKEETERGVDHCESFITAEPRQIKSPTSKVTTDSSLYLENETLKRDSCEIQDIQTNEENSSEISASKSVRSRTFDSCSVDITNTAVTSITVDYEHDIIGVTHSLTKDNIQANKDRESICDDENNSSVANYSSLIHGQQTITCDQISDANEATKTGKEGVNQAVLSGNSDIDKLYEFPNREILSEEEKSTNIHEYFSETREILTEENKSFNIHECPDENSHKGIAQHLPSTLPFIDRTEHVISQSYETLIVRNSTTTHQSREISSSSRDPEYHNTTRDLRDGSLTKEDYLQTDFSSMETRADGFEEEVYDNLEDFKSVRKTGLKINLAKNPSSVLSRNRMQTIGEHEEVNFSNRLEYATVQRPATPVENVALKNSSTHYNTQIQDRDVSRHGVLKNEQSSQFTSVQSDHSMSFESKDNNFNSSFSDVFSQPRFNLTGSQFLGPMHSSPYQHEPTTNYERNPTNVRKELFHSSPYQHDSATNFERNTNVRKDLFDSSPYQHDSATSYERSSTNVRKELIPSTSYHGGTTSSSMMQYQNLVLGEIGNENMGQTFHFGRRGPTLQEEEEEEEEDWEREKERVEIREQASSVGEVDGNWDRSTESINIHDLSFISDSSSIYQASCSAEITDHEESGYETKYLESELLNISCDSSSTYSAICTAEVTVDATEGTEQLSSTQNTIILSPSSEVSDPESGYYTLPRTGKDSEKDSLRRQDTTEDMTLFLEEEDKERTIYHDKMYGEILEENTSVQLEREDVAGFSESSGFINSGRHSSVRGLSSEATVQHVNLQEEFTRFSERSSFNLDFQEQNPAKISTENRTLQSPNIHEDPRSFAATQQLQDIVDFSEQLAAEFESFADESLEEDSSTFHLEKIDNVHEEPIKGGYKVEAMAEISSEDIQFDSYEVRNATKIVTTEVQYFNSVRDVTDSFEISDGSGHYTVQASAEISSDDIQFDYLNEVQDSTVENTVTIQEVENSYRYHESEKNRNVEYHKDHSNGQIAESFHEDVVKQTTKVIKTETEYFNSTEDLTGCIEIEVEEETTLNHEHQFTNKSDISTETSSRNLKAEDVATLRRFSVDKMGTMDGNVVHLPRVNSTEDMTSFEDSIDITKRSDKPSEFYTNLEQSSVKLVSRNEKDNDQTMDRTEEESGQVLPSIERTEHIVSLPYETITVSRKSTTHHFDVSSFVSLYKNSCNLQQDEVTETGHKVKGFENINQDTAATENKYSEEGEEISTCIETTYIYNGSNVLYDEKVLDQKEGCEEEDEEEEEEELNQRSNKNQTEKDEEFPHQTETEERLLEDDDVKIVASRLYSTMEISEGVQKMSRPSTESHSKEKDATRSEIEIARSNLLTSSISDGGNMYHQRDTTRNTQYDISTTIETTTSTIESRSWQEQNINTSNVQSSSSEEYCTNNVQIQETHNETEKTSDYETNSQLLTTEDENWTSQTDYYDLSSTSSQYGEESYQTSAVQTHTASEFKTNVTSTEDEVSHTVDDYEINTHTRTMEDKLQEIISSESSIDHTEQFESLVEKDRNKIQMFVIYQDFAQMREHARLKKELELLSEQCEHLENRRLENRTEKLLKINSFLDCFLQNLRITENIQVMKSKLENVKHVERVDFYQDNSLVYEQMQKFSDIIRELDLHRDDDRLGAKLTYCLKFLKTKTLDAQFESLADFVCQESEKEDMELLQNHLCLVKDGGFGSRRLLKYLSRGFSSDMKTIWKPRLRNSLQSVCEDEESVFHCKNRYSSSKHSNGDKQCCEFHDSDRSCSAQLELWSDSVQGDNSSSQKISRTAYIN